MINMIDAKIKMSEIKGNKVFYQHKDYNWIKQRKTR